MRIDYIARNCELSEKLKSVAEKKLNKLDKYFGENEPRAKMSFKKQASSLTLEVMLDYCGNFVRATASSDSFYDDIDVVLSKIEGQIRKYRTRFDKHNKNSAFNTLAEYEDEIKTEKNNANLVKEKRFKLTPMTVKEAQEEMELLGHSFYVFLEAKTNTVQVLYLRNDGDLGLIEPEI